MDHQLEFRVLGPLEIVADGRPIKVDAPKQRAILAMLLIHANEVVSTDRLMDAIWRDDEVGVGTLRYHVSKLRENLQSEIGSAAEEIVATEAPGYVLRVDGLDAARFDALVDEARQDLQSSPDSALRKLDEALGQWRGEAYAEYAYEEFAHLEAERLAEKRRGAIEDRMDALLALGRHTDAVAELEGLAAEQPLRERLWGQLALALYRCGRQSEAVAALQQIRDELGEVGLDLSPPLKELEQRVFSQDPALLDETTTPDQLRGYVLRGVVGEGAHAVVWRAAQPGIGREVALKAIRPELANQPEFVRRFEAEAQLVASLEHPNIISLYDFWRDPDGAYLVMPYLRGGNLAGVLRQGPLETTQLLEIVTAIGSALGHAHRRGVVHRDVTPHNVLLDEEGHPYLADFGMAALLGGNGPSVTSSPAYMSPEESAGKKAVIQSDVFSLGVLVHAALSDRVPVAGEPLPPMSELRHDLPPAVDDVIACATAPDVANRYTSIAAFVDALARAIGVGREEVPVLDVADLNPYKGLRAFEESDAADFFGREMLVSEVAQTVGRQRLVGVVGPSGCGKSSLVKAGVIPQLRRGVLPGSEQWLITDMYPGSRPLSELEAALLRVAVERPPQLAKALAGEGAELGEAFDQLLPRHSELFLVVDQFEELFTLTTSEEERTRFLAVLTELASKASLRVRVMVTLRADFYDRPLEYPEFGQLLRRGLVSVTMPTAEYLREAITGPARRVGLGVDDALVESIVRDVSGQPGGLPLMEYALTELFERRHGPHLTIEAYRTTAGVVGALGRRAEDLYKRYDEAGRDAVRQTFLRLVTVEEGVADTRRRIPLSELRGLEIDGDALGQVLDDYGSHRLLTFDRDPDTREPTVEVAHEALLGRWDRLRTWIDDRRDDLSSYRRLAAAAKEWTDSDGADEYLLTGGRLEHYQAFAAETDLFLTSTEAEYLSVSRTYNEDLASRRGRRRRAIMAGFGIAAMIASVLAVLAFVNQQKAEDEALVARARDLASSALVAAESDPLLAMNLAVLSVETLPSGAEPGPALETALRTAKAADRSAGRYEFETTDWTPADVSPDGSTVAAIDGEQLLVVLDSATVEEELWSYRDPGSDIFQNVAYSSDGEFIVVSVFDERAYGQEADDAEGDPDPRLLVFQADSGELIRTHPIELEGACLAGVSTGSWRSDLGLLGFGVDNCNMEGIAFQFVDTTTWEVVYEHPIPPNDFGFVYFGRQGTLAAIASGYNSGAKSWLIDTADWSIVRELDYPMVVLSPDGARLAGYDNWQLDVVVVEEAITGDVINRLPTGNAHVFDLRFSPEGDVLAIGTRANATRLFDPGTGELMDTIQPAAVAALAFDDNYLYVSGGGVVSKWDRSGIGLGDLNTVPLGLWVNGNSIFWNSGGTVVADVGDSNGEWSLYPVDPSTGDLGEPIPYGQGSWGIVPITGDRVVMFRYRKTASGVPEYGPLEVVDLSTGDSTVLAGCWMERQAALAHEPCPNGQPHPAGEMTTQGSRDGTEFMIIDLQESAGRATEVFASIWDSSTLTETSRISLGAAEAYAIQSYSRSVLTDEHLVAISGNGTIRVLDRVTDKALFEETAMGHRYTEHDRAQNRVWMSIHSDTEIWLLDLDTLEFRPVTGYVADKIRGLATSPSGEMVAVMSADGFVRVYTDEGELRHKIPLPNPSDAWWLDEENLVVGTGNGPWTVITLDSDRLLGAVKDSLERGFSDAECSLYEIDPCPTLEELRGY